MGSWVGVGVAGGQGGKVQLAVGLLEGDSSPGGEDSHQVEGNHLALADKFLPGEGNLGDIPLPVVGNPGVGIPHLVDILLPGVDIQREGSL